MTNAEVSASEQDEKEKDEKHARKECKPRHESHIGGKPSGGNLPDSERCNNEPENLSIDEAMMTEQRPEDSFDIQEQMNVDELIPHTLPERT